MRILHLNALHWKFNFNNGCNIPWEQTWSAAQPNPKTFYSCTYKKKVFTICCSMLGMVGLDLQVTEKVRIRDRWSNGKNVNCRCSNHDSSVRMWYSSSASLLHVALLYLTFRFHPPPFLPPAPTPPLHTTRETTVSCSHYSYLSHTLVYSSVAAIVHYDLR